MLLIGQEGLEKAIEFEPNLIITDLTMPVMDGFEMIRKLRDRKLTEVIVIANSCKRV